MHTVLPSWCAGFLHPRRTSDDKKRGAPSDPTRHRSLPAPMRLPGIHKYCWGSWYQDPASDHRGL